VISQAKTGTNPSNYPLFAESLNRTCTLLGLKPGPIWGVSVSGDECTCKQVGGEIMFYYIQNNRDWIETDKSEFDFRFTSFPGTRLTFLRLLFFDDPPIKIHQPSTVGSVGEDRSFQLPTTKHAISQSTQSGIYPVHNQKIQTVYFF